VFNLTHPPLKPGHATKQQLELNYMKTKTIPKQNRTHKHYLNKYLQVWW